MAKKILFVDDEPYVVLLMKRRIEHAGYTVVTAASAEEGIAKAKAEKPDLIVMDHSMPKMSGMDLCKKLKQDSTTQGIQLIVYTANTEKGIEESYITAGAVGIVYKPLVVELLTLIKRVLAGEKIDWSEYQP